MSGVIISRIHEAKLKAKIEESEKLRAKYAKEKSEAHAEGDLRENQAFHTAKEALERETEKYTKLRERLSKAQVLDIDNSPNLKICSLFKIWTNVPEKGTDPNNEECWEKERLLMLLPEGEPVLDGILAMNTPIGEVISNKLSPIGQYTVFEVGNKPVRVMKVSSEYSKEFEELYPGEEVFFERLFGGE